MSGPSSISYAGTTAFPPSTDRNVDKTDSSPDHPVAKLAKKTAKAVGIGLALAIGSAIVNIALCAVVGLIIGASAALLGHIIVISLATVAALTIGGFCLGAIAAGVVAIAIKTGLVKPENMMLSKKNPVAKEINYAIQLIADAVQPRQEILIDAKV